MKLLEVSSFYLMLEVLKQEKLHVWVKIFVAFKVQAKYLWHEELSIVIGLGSWIVVWVECVVIVLNFCALFFDFDVVFRVKKFILLIKFLLESFSGHQWWQILTSRQVLFLLLNHCSTFGHRICLSTDRSLDCLFLEVSWAFYVAAPVILWTDDKVGFLGELGDGVGDWGQLWGFF